MFEDKIIQLIKEKDEEKVIALLKTRPTQSIFPDLEGYYPDSKNLVATKKPVYLWAAKYGLINVMQELEIQGANFKSQCSAKRNVLYYVCESNNIITLRHVLDKMHALLTKDEFTTWINNQNYDVSKGTLIHHAARRNRVEVVKLLKQADAKLDLFNEVGFAPIHAAVMCSCLETVKELLADPVQAKIQVNLFAQSYGYEGKTAFHISLMIKDEQEINHKKKENAKTEKKKEPIKIIQTLLEFDSTLAHQKTIDQKTPLFIAIKYGVLKSIKYLTEFGVIPNENEVKFAKKMYSSMNDGIYCEILRLLNNQSKSQIALSELLQPKNDAKSNIADFQKKNFQHEESQQPKIILIDDAINLLELSLVPTESILALADKQKPNTLLATHTQQSLIANTNSFFYSNSKNFTDQPTISHLRQYNCNVHGQLKRKKEDNQIDNRPAKKTKLNPSEQENVVQSTKGEFAKILNNDSKANYKDISFVFNPPTL